MKHLQEAFSLLNPMSFVSDEEHQVFCQCLEYAEKATLAALQSPKPEDAALYLYAAQGIAPIAVEHDWDGMGGYEVIEHGIGGSGLYSYPIDHCKDWKGNRVEVAIREE